jgi:peroxiredoxin Q/BCP
VKIGDSVENFSLVDKYNNNFVLYDNLVKDILLIFYPKDNTPVCTKELVDYSLNQRELGKCGTKTIGINIDPVNLHKTFCENKKIDFPVLSDPEKRVSKFFDALNLLGQNKRKLVLVGKDRRIKFEKSTLSIFFVSTEQLFEHLKKRQLI